MRTFKRLSKHFLRSVLLIAIFSANNFVIAETAVAEEQDAHHGHGKQDWPGIYNGLLPCDDCYGIKTSLALNKNGSYILISKYAGKSEREFVEKGKFSVDKNNTIVLTPRKGSSVVRQYRVGENMLIQLDEKGKQVTGKLAERYILRRTDVTDNPPSQHSGH
jgi:uncharacterized lipoprotein NlpE involved in copper resistance